MICTTCTREATPGYVTCLVCRNAKHFSTMTARQRAKAEKAAFLARHRTASPVIEKAKASSPNYTGRTLGLCQVDAFAGGHSWHCTCLACGQKFDANTDTIELGRAAKRGCGCKSRRAPSPPGLGFRAQVPK